MNAELVPQVHPEISIRVCWTTRCNGVSTAIVERFSCLLVLNGVRTLDRDRIIPHGNGEATCVIIAHEKGQFLESQIDLSPKGPADDFQFCARKNGQGILDAIDVRE